MRALTHRWQFILAGEVVFLTLWTARLLIEGRWYW